MTQRRPGKTPGPILADGLLADMLRIADARGITQVELADRMGTYQVRVNAWRQGRNSITLRVADEMAQALGGRLKFEESKA
jgi:transcriptional regulator with XRE-family HTH domain